jgi:signal peptidase I
MNLTEKTLSFLKEIFQTIFISLAVFLIVYIFLFQPHRVKGDSMLPNYYNNELLLTEKVSYRFGDPSRGDVIVFRAPGSRNVDFIKRIVALPGDFVKIENGSVFINGNELPEPYETQKTQGAESISLSDGEYFVLGDNRGSSSDSRSFGPIDEDSIKGRVFFVYWPFFEGKTSNGLRKVSRITYSISNVLDDQ